MDDAAPYTVQLSIGGMTCAACVGSIIDGVANLALQGVSNLSVNLLSKSATAHLTDPALAPILASAVEDMGFECRVIDVVPSTKGMVQTAKGDASSETTKEASSRTAALQLVGSSSVPKKVIDALDAMVSPRITIIDSLPHAPKNVLRIIYTPSPPEATIRTIVDVMSREAGPNVRVTIWHPPTMDDLARELHQREQHNLLLRLLVAILAAVPTFVIGIVYMTLLPKKNPGRRWFERPIWAGTVMRGEWALWFCATPVMFYSAEIFHRKALKEIWFLWRPGSRVPLISRFLKFGSMNLLISLGVTVAYVSSLANLIVAARKQLSFHIKTGHEEMDVMSMGYFDSVVFLAMFLLIGRYLEAFSKHQAASALTLLKALHSSDAILVKQRPLALGKDRTLSLEEPDTPYSSHSDTFSTTTEKIPTEFLEVGDVVRVPAGATPPADGAIVAAIRSTEYEDDLKPLTYFDESSLTGESRGVAKRVGDSVYVGTINKGASVDVRVDAVGGETMLEKIIEVVRQGQTKRAPIERFADLITSRFVPIVTALAILTWVIWLSLGLTGSIKGEDVEGTGGWVVWSLEFAIAVFVIACPCGIGLAAPTALLVGSTVAAKHGILARGGGEAFQEASSISVMVFDKTGTITEGVEPRVVDTWTKEITDREDEEALTVPNLRVLVRDAIRQLASASSHPLCVALLHHLAKNNSSADCAVRLDPVEVKEISGKGMEGTFRVYSPQDAGSRGGASTPPDQRIHILMGNERLLLEGGCLPWTGRDEDKLLGRMKGEGKSVVLVAVAFSNSPSGSNISRSCELEIEESPTYSLHAVFGIADPIRPEAAAVIRALQEKGVETWMISGDNEVTARAVARMVGISGERVIGGVLPEQKAEKIQELQGLGSLLGSRPGDSKGERRVIAMVGDGINDAAALTTADVGIAIGSGSDVALSSAKFILMSSDLKTLLTLTDLSRRVFNRIRFNFFWACVYNLIALPIAAGVIYPAGRAKLNPVWSALAMALSSTSVVCSSLLLRLYRAPIPVENALHDSTKPDLRDVEKAAV